MGRSEFRREKYPDFLLRMRVMQTDDRIRTIQAGLIQRCTVGCSLGKFADI